MGNDATPLWRSTASKASFVQVSCHADARIALIRTSSAVQEVMSKGDCANRNDKTEPRDGKHCPEIVLQGGGFAMSVRGFCSGKSCQHATCGMSTCRFGHVGEAVWHVRGPVACCMSADKLGTSASLVWHVGGSITTSARNFCHFGASVWHVGGAGLHVHFLKQFVFSTPCAKNLGGTVVQPRCYAPVVFSVWRRTFAGSFPLKVPRSKARRLPRPSGMKRLLHLQSLQRIPAWSEQMFTECVAHWPRKSLSIIACSDSLRMAPADC